MGKPSYLAAFWVMWGIATAEFLRGHFDVATFDLGLAILFRLFWQESPRD